MVNITADLQGVNFNNAIPSQYLFVGVIWDTGINQTMKYTKITSMQLNMILQVPKNVSEKSLLFPIFVKRKQRL